MIPEISAPLLSGVPNGGPGHGARSGHAKDATLIPEVVGALSDGAHCGGGLNRQDAYSGHIFPVPSVTHTMRGEGFDASEDGTGRGTPIVTAYNITPSNSNKDYNARETERSQAITTGGNRPSARGGDVIAFAQNQRDEVRLMDQAGALAAEPGAKQQTYVFKQGQGSKAGSIGGDENVSPTLGAADSGTNRTPALMQGMAVRRLTPLECERLQGFPDGYTDIPSASDSGRYKALGNSMAVPVMRWIGERIATAPRGQT